MLYSLNGYVEFCAVGATITL